MRLTGKCKEDFDNWRISKKDSYLKHCFFEELMPSMRYGVYLDFFDSVGMMIELQLHVNPTMQGGSFKCIRPAIFSDGRFHNVGASFGTRERARAASIKKANEIYNLK